MRITFFMISGAALFTYSEANLHSFYENMEKICEHHQIFTLQVTITSPVVTSPYSTARFRGRVISANDKDVDRVLKNKTLRFSSRSPVPPVGTITIQGRYSAPQRAKGPLSFNERNHFAVNNIHGSFQISRILPDSAPPPSHLALFSHTLRSQVHSVINKAESEEVRGIFHAAFLAENEYRSRSLDATFRKAGVVHLLAISGFHAALLLTAIVTALKICGVPYRLRMILSISALWGYLFFIGFIPSLFRATVMVTFFCLSMLLQRKNHSIHSLGTAGLFWLYLSPHSLFSAGFQLSFAATASIILLQPILCTMTPKLQNRRSDFLIRQALTPFWLSVTTSAATIPVLLHHFGTFSIYGIFFNPVAIPLMAAAMWFFFGAVILSPIAPLCNLSILGAEKILSSMIYLSRFSERFALSEIVISNTTALQLFAISTFIIGLCAVNKNLRKPFLLHAGALSAFLIAIAALQSSTKAAIEISEFKSPHALVNVIIHPDRDKTAWISAQGKCSEIKRVREREIEPFLKRKKVMAVPLFIVSEEAQKEAHEFTFSTGFNPHIIVLRDEHLSDKNESGYKRIDLRYIISSNAACSLKIDTYDTGKPRVKPRAANLAHPALLH
ncbi:MAG: ComEC/Rec2 family competence protein [Chitinispirillia bacterium]|nr:ComEC/Rec2 family competence protein [Chitinispirillia bacterium]